MISALLMPALVLGGMGLLFGLGLGFASIKFRIDKDPNLPPICEALPAANCGGCGYTDCEAFADAVIKGGAKPTGCPVGGEDSARRIGEILGIAVDKTVHTCAYIKCGGCDSKSTFRYDYFGLRDCRAAMQLAGGGSKSCACGCSGVGSCVEACEFNAIYMEDGIAAVDPEKCIACTMCVSACPKNLIKMVPDKNKIHVACNSKDPGREVRKYCKVGCIGCKLCEKGCGFDAIHIKNNLASIIYAKCTQCGACIAKCPSKSIVNGLQKAVR